MSEEWQSFEDWEEYRKEIMDEIADSYPMHQVMEIGDESEEGLYLSVVKLDEIEEGNKIIRSYALIDNEVTLEAEIIIDYESYAVLTSKNSGLEYASKLRQAVAQFLANHEVISGFEVSGHNGKIPCEDPSMDMNKAVEYASSDLLTDSGCDLSDEDLGKRVEELSRKSEQ